jgi:hypothetical protein
MPFHFAELISERNSAGVIVVSKKTSISTVIDELVLIRVALTAEEFQNRIASIA